MLHRRSFLAALAGAPLALNAAPSNEEQAARKAAEQWLALIDAGDYDASWEAAASFFKKNVSKEQWHGQAGKVRGMTGKFESRTFAASQRRRSLPGAPDGDYVVIQFRAKFANKAEAVETVTPMRETDGSWRVSGYFIR